MKYFLALLLVATTILPFAAKADVAPSPGYHAYVSAVVVDNLSDFPAYDVYSSFSGRFGESPRLAQGTDDIAAIVKSADDHHSTEAPFYAVLKDNQAKIFHQDDAGGELGDIWYKLSQNQKYIATAEVTGTPKPIDSKLTTGHVGISDSNPTVAFVSVYHIDRLDATHFDMSLVGQSQYDKNSQLLSTTVPADNDTDKSALVDMIETPYLLFGAVVALGVLMLLAGWKWAVKK